MRIYFIACSIFLGFQSAQTLSCYFCDLDSTFDSCLSGVTTKECDASVGFDRCSSFTVSLTKADGQHVTYLEKDCGISFICENSDPDLVCNSKNQSYSEQGGVMTNCSGYCCTTPSLCNNDGLLPQPAAPSPSAAPTPSVAPTPSTSSSVAATAAITGTPVNNPGTQAPNGSTTATPAHCAANSLNIAVRMTVILSASFLFLGFLA